MRGILDHSMSFRNGFWFKTLARFFVLDLFMQFHPDKPCLQIEADVFLFSSFPISEFRQLNVEIAFPMESKDRGIASLLYLKNHTASGMLAAFAIETVKLNPETTDMSLLGLLAHSQKMNFLALQTLPEDMWGSLYQPEARELVCNNDLDLPGVFDGITIGQYLLGIDPRNARGIRVLHRPQPSHAIDPSKLLLELDVEGNLVVSGPSGSSRIYNLHNHAKDLRIYSKNSREKLLKKRLISVKDGEQKEIIFKLVAEALVKSFQRRIRIAFTSK